MFVSFLLISCTGVFSDSQSSRTITQDEVNNSADGEPKRSKNLTSTANLTDESTLSVSSSSKSIDAGEEDFSDQPSGNRNLSFPVILSKHLIDSLNLSYIVD